MVFTSDNGSRAEKGGSNDPLRGTKATTWEGGMRVPCIAWWPGRVPAGTTCSAVATSMDLFPTLVGLAGAEVPAGRAIDGRDIRPLLLGEDTASPHEAFLYYSGNNLEAVRSGRWKLHLAKGKVVEELYDLEADVGETTNRYADEPDVVAELQARRAGPGRAGRCPARDHRLRRGPRPGRRPGDPDDIRPGPPVLPGRVRPPSAGSPLPPALRSVAMRGLMTLIIVVAGVAFGLAACQPSSDCGRVLTRDTTLRADVLNCPGDGLVIGADGIELRLAGHTVDGGGVGQRRHRVAGHDGVVVSGLAGSRGSPTGSAAGRTGNRVRDLEVTENGVGIHLVDADGGRVVGNHPFSNEGGISGPNRGVLLEDSDGNLLSGNTVFEDDFTCIELLRSHGNRSSTTPPTTPTARTST